MEQAKNNLAIRIFIAAVGLLILVLISLKTEEDNSKLTEAKIQKILETAPRAEGLRGDILDTSYLLLGKVTYVWGGKETNTDLNNLPQGLDCSGYTGWVYKHSGASDVIYGSGTAFQWDNSYEIKESELLPGDLGFLKLPSEASDISPNHVGIFAGKNKNGNNLFIHCSRKKGVMLEEYPDFIYFRRVNGL